MPEAFFYFTALDSDDRKRWAEEILVERRVYFRDRTQLNDPNELRPTIKFEGTSKQVREFVRDLLVHQSPVRLSPAKRLLEENRLIHAYSTNAVWIQQSLNEVLDGIGLFCVSETPEQPLLWAHYANGHRGICIEFDPNSSFFTAAQQVTYSAEAPVINRIVDSPQTLLEKSVLTKNLHWAYEREWRVIARWGDAERIRRYLQQHAVSDEVAQFIRDAHGPGHYSISPNSLRSVIVGSNTSVADRDWIRALVARTGLPVAIKRAVLAGNGIVNIRDD